MRLFENYIDTTGENRLKFYFLGFIQSFLARTKQIRSSQHSSRMLIIEKHFLIDMIEKNKLKVYFPSWEGNINKPGQHSSRMSLIRESFKEQYSKAK